MLASLDERPTLTDLDYAGHHDHPATRTPLPRRLAASAVDACLLVALPALWWHWSEWAVYTDTFGRRWPPTIAMPVMALIPLAVVWLEAVTGQGAGKALCGLHVRAAGGGRASLSRRAARAAVKWSPLWVGIAGHVACLAARSPAAEDFSADWLMPLSTELADRLPGHAKQVGWALGVSLRGMSLGALLLPPLAVGQLGLLLPGRRTLIDRVTGTRVAGGR